jgi:hypothetical protein
VIGRLCPPFVHERPVENEDRGEPAGGALQAIAVDAIERLGRGAGTEPQGREGISEIVDPAHGLDPSGSLCGLAVDAGLSCSESSGLKRGQASGGSLAHR